MTYLWHGWMSLDRLGSHPVGSVCRIGLKWRQYACIFLQATHSPHWFESKKITCSEICIIFFETYREWTKNWGRLTKSTAESQSIRIIWVLSPGSSLTSKCPTGTLDGSRREWGVFLEAGNCLFHNWEGGVYIISSSFPEFLCDFTLSSNFFLISHKFSL